MTKLLKFPLLVCLLVGSLGMVNLAQAEPADIKVVMDNQLTGSVTFGFEFAKEPAVSYWLAFEPGKSTRVVTVHDKNLISSDIKSSFTPWNSGEEYKCQINAIANFEPTTINVWITKDYNCQISLQ